MIDFSQIEARILGWLSGQTDLVLAFHEYDAGRGPDVYRYTANKVGSPNRNLGKVLVLACGYGMGWVKFRETARTYGVILSDEEAQDALSDWKAANSFIQTYWWDMHTAVLAAMGVKPSRSQQVMHGPLGNMQTMRRNVMIKQVSRALVIKKPGGGKLYYHNARTGKNAHGDLFEFDGPMEQGTKWISQNSYGGRFVENLCQSVARDILAEAYVRIWTLTGRVPVFSVHDELVYEVDGWDDAGALQVLADTLPPWATGLPIASKLHVAFRYAKGD
jgi:DNA polymerase